MVDERRQDAVKYRGAATDGGRFGEAPRDRPHVEPEVAPLGIGGAELRVPDAIPGALPENRSPRDAEE